MITLPIPIAVDHPAFAGHFPSSPVVPGVVLLAESLRAIDRHSASSGLLRAPLTIGNAKFLSMVGPGDPVRLECERSSDTTMTLRIYAGANGDERLAMSGVLTHRSAVS